MVQIIPKSWVRFIHWMKSKLTLWKHLPTLSTTTLFLTVTYSLLYLRCYEAWQIFWLLITMLIWCLVIPFLGNVHTDKVQTLNAMQVQVVLGKTVGYETIIGWHWQRRIVHYNCYIFPNYFQFHNSISCISSSCNHEHFIGIRYTFLMAPQTINNNIVIVIHFRIVSSTIQILQLSNSCQKMILLGLVNSHSLSKTKAWITF